jgi:hypothetical protein
MTKLTRRQLATVVTAASATALGAQTAPADDLEAARQRQKANSDVLAQQQIPMAIEPAFQFKA